MNAKDAIDLNCAIIRVLGLHPEDIARDPAPVITLESNGPVVTVTHYCRNADGQFFANPDNTIASIVRRYRLVAVEDET